MIIKCNKSDEKRILEYIGKDYGKCAYLYIDLMKYGFDNENVRLWMDVEGDEIKLVVLNYYTGVHLFSRENEFDVDGIVEVLEEIKPSLICGMSYTIEKVREKMTGYEYEEGVVGQLRDIADIDTEGCYKASLDEIKELAAVLAEDDALGKPYGFDLLYKQLAERYQENFGRNFIYRENGKIVATASTYAEEAGLSVISGVFTDIECRGKGLSKKVLAAICKDLKADGFDVMSYYYIPSAHKVHNFVGFEDLGIWAKLIRE